MDPSGVHANCQSHIQSTCIDNESHQRGAGTGVDRLTPEVRNRNHHGWRRVILNFTPSWFSVTMGTGIVAILLHNLPYNAVWLYWISVVLFCLNIIIFLTFLFMSILRYLMFPGLFMFMIHHPVQSLFLGTLPMGLATIINMVVFVCVPAWGENAVMLAWALWWIDVVLAIAICVFLPFNIMLAHETKLSNMTAVWLLPIVSTIVAAATGGIVAEVLPNPQHALWTIITSYILWGTGFPLAMVVLVMYFHRLTIHKLPSREVIVSVFLPLGPLGQGSFALMQLGKVAMQIFPITNTEMLAIAGQVNYIVSINLALIIWGYGLVWLFFAVASISQHKFPFNMGWWGFTFPLGVYAVSTTTLAQDLPSQFFKVLGTIFSLAVVALWLVVSARTLKGVVSGKIFFAPCVKDYERIMAERQKEKSAASSISSEPQQTV